MEKRRTKLGNIGISKDLAESMKELREFREAKKELKQASKELKEFEKKHKPKKQLTSSKSRRKNRQQNADSLFLLEDASTIHTTQSNEDTQNKVAAKMRALSKKSESFRQNIEEIRAIAYILVQLDLDPVKSDARSFAKSFIEGEAKALVESENEEPRTGKQGMCKVYKRLSKSRKALVRFVSSVRTETRKAEALCRNGQDCEQITSKFDYMNKAYVGPLFSREGTCGTATTFNLANGVNGVDYFPPRRCLPSSSRLSIAPVGDASSEAVSFSKDAVEVEYDASLDKVTVEFDCAKSEFCKKVSSGCDSYSATFMVRDESTGKDLYAVNVAGKSYSITPLCGSRLKPEYMGS